MEPAVRRSASVHQECPVIMWPESASENALPVVMERTVIRVCGSRGEVSSSFKTPLSSVFILLCWDKFFPCAPCQTVQREGLAQAAFILATAPVPRVTQWWDNASAQRGRRESTVRTVSSSGRSLTAKCKVTTHILHDNKNVNINVYYSVSGGFLGSRLHRNLPSLWEWRRVW